MTSSPTQVLRPDFVVRLHVGPDETTATLYAYRGDVAAAARGLPRQHRLNDVVERRLLMPSADFADVVAGHANKSRGAVYPGGNGSRPATWVQHPAYDEKGDHSL